MITRGTTSYKSFVVPYTTDMISIAYITYLQNNKVVVEKSIEDITIEDISDSSSQLTIYLTQEDTLKFNFYPAAEKNIAVGQVRILTNEEEAYASEPTKERIFGVLKEGIISNNSN